MILTIIMIGCCTAFIIVVVLVVSTIGVTTQRLCAGGQDQQRRQHISDIDRWQLHCANAGTGLTCRCALLSLSASDDAGRRGWGKWVIGKRENASDDAGRRRGWGGWAIG